jgi:Domain of unknown function (DUF222)/HNH endonuclease
VHVLASRVRPTGNVVPACHYGVVSYPPTPFAVDARPNERLEVLFEELAELTGQRNAIDGRVVDIVAEIDRDGIWGNTGCRSVAALVAWKTGMSPPNAQTVAAVAHRIGAFGQCAQGLREGRLSLDQVGAIAAGAANATVTQLRKAVSLEPQPDPPTPPEPKRSITTYTSGPDAEHTTWKITLPKLDAAKFDAALHAHREALIADCNRDRDAHGVDDPYDRADAVTPTMTDLPVPMPTTVDAFINLVEAGWDTEAARRPHGQHTTVIAHLDVEQHIAALHLGPLLSHTERQFLLCDATCEVWFHKRGQVIGTARTTRTVGRRLRRALEHRDHGTCVVPGCPATRGLHAHHIVHWEDGGPTELHNLVLVCPHHHRMHHRGQITITGPADHLIVTDAFGTTLTNRSLARPPTHPPPPCVAPYQGPTGEPAQWWWYDPYQPQPPPNTN